MAETTGETAQTGDRFYGTGRRKSSVARVWLKPGSGNIVVNGRPLDNFFSRFFCQSSVMRPLELVDLATRFDVSANVRGGGTTGQADAIRHGISRALLEYDSALRAPLKKSGLLTRDAREKERKKYGQPGARKRYQFSKR